MTKIDEVIEIINTYAKLKGQYDYTLDKLNTSFRMISRMLTTKYYIIIWN